MNFHRVNVRDDEAFMAWFDVLHRSEIQHERRVEEMDRDLLEAVALHRESATLVGYSERTVSRERPGTAYQWDTLVLGALRGHRLGGLLKIATMRLLEQDGYDTTTITAYIARTNEPMIAVSEALSARVTGSIVAWRMSLAMKTERER